MLGLETALALALGELDLPIGAGARPARAGSRPRSPGSTRARRDPGRAGCAPGPRPTSASSTRPPPGRSIPRRWRAGAATPPMPVMRLTGRVRHTVFRGEPVVVDAEVAAMSVGILGPARSEALLVLGDGETSRGRRSARIPTTVVATGEAVFNTVLSGYQEVITDPSYAGQVIAFTYPHIGNYGVNPTDDEARSTALQGHRRPRPRRTAEQLAGDRQPRGVPRAALDPGHDRGRHPPAHPAPARPGRDALRLRHRAGRGARRRCGRGETDRRCRPGERRDRHDDLGARERSLPGRRLRLRDQRGDVATAR